MNELAPTREQEFIWRRLGEAFPLSGPEDSTVLLLAVAGGLFLFAVGAFLATILKKGRADSVAFWVTAVTRAAILILPAALLLVGKYGGLKQPKVLWQTLTVGTFLLAAALTVLSYLRDSRNHFGWWSLAFVGWLLGGAALAAGPTALVLLEHPIGFSRAGFVETTPAWMWLGVIAWWTVPVAILLLGLFVGVTGLIREPKHVGLFWTPLLAQLRIGVYAVLAVAFLLPAVQEKERTVKQSRVLILIDVSPSVSPPPGESAKRAWEPGKARLEKILDFLTDANATGEADKVNFLSNLLDRNPVFAFRFGKQLDDDAQAFPLKSAPWTREEWAAWAKYDFRPVALRGLSKDGREKAKAAAAWKAEEPGNAEWATAWAKAAEAEVAPEGMAADDKAALKANQTKLLARVEVARSVVTGTDVPVSVQDLLRREAGNMVTGVILFSDGRSNAGSSGNPIAQLRETAVKEKIPLFTVAVGEVRENVAIDITDITAPSATGPDEPFAVTVAVDGVGLPGQETDVFLDVFMPGQDPKKDRPVHTITKKVKFLPGDPPRGEVEFRLDAEDPTLNEVMIEPTKKEGRTKQFKLSVGKENWKLVARVPVDKRELFDGKEHVTAPREVLIQDRVLRVLLVASAPSREYQTLRTLLVREQQEKRARLCVLIQNEGGLKGDIVQDVEPDQILTRFPDRLDTVNDGNAEDRPGYYNLNTYDLVIMFDPDWEEKSTDGTSRISDESLKNLDRWVNQLGGGLMYVAAPVHTYGLARADETGRLRPLVDLLPVAVRDIVKDTDPKVMEWKRQRNIKEPRRLLLNPTPLANLLRLEEDVLKDATDPASQVAGWERFFTGKDRFEPVQAAITYKPARGIYGYYPVVKKPTAVVLAEYVSQDDPERFDPEKLVKVPYLAFTQAGRGRSAFLGSGEIFRIRQIDTAFYDRFWIKMCRFLVAQRDARMSRGRVLISKEYPSGAPIRVQARILGPNAQPYPLDGASSINAKFRIEQLKTSGEKVRDIGTFPLTPRKGTGEFGGDYVGQAIADPKLMPADNFRYKVVVDVPDSGDPLTDTFLLRQSDPELDNLRPDFEAMAAMASSLEEVRPNIIDPKTLLALRGTAPDDARAKLAFKITDTDKLKLIPQCIVDRKVPNVLRGKVDDLWDNEMEPPADGGAGDTNFFASNLFGDGRVGRWGNVLAGSLLLLALAALVVAIWVKPLVWLGYLFTVAAVAFAYFGNPFPVGDLASVIKPDDVPGFRASVVTPLSKLWVLIAAAALATLAVGGWIAAIWVRWVKWIALPLFLLALLLVAPAALFHDAPVSLRGVVLPFQQEAFLGLQLGTVLAIGFGLLAVVGAVGAMFLRPLGWVAISGFVLGLLALAPVLLFADFVTHEKAVGASAPLPVLDAPYLVLVRWGMLLTLPLALLSAAFFVLSLSVSGFKWAGLAMLLAAGAALYLTYPFPVGVVIAVCVSLLSFEWMTRKLMRLA